MYFVVCKGYETIYTISVEILTLLLTTKKITKNGKQFPPLTAVT